MFFYLINIINNMEIVGYPNYMIYDDGRVWSSTRGKGKFLKPCFDGRGYLKVCLSNDGIPKNMKIHRLVALHYIPNPDNKPEVDHIDRERLNNNIENLRWATSSENQSNKGIMRIHGAVKFRGVAKKGNKFTAKITIDGKSKYIGVYDTPEEASEAYNNYVNA